MCQWLYPRERGRADELKPMNESQVPKFRAEAGPSLLPVPWTVSPDTFGSVPTALHPTVRLTSPERK